MKNSATDLNGIEDLENLEPIQEKQSTGFLENIRDESDFCATLRVLNRNKWRLIKRFDFEDLSDFTWKEDFGDVGNDLARLINYHTAKSSIHNDSESATRLQMLGTIDSYVRNISHEIEEKVRREEPYSLKNMVVDLFPYFLMADDYTQSHVMNKHGIVGKRRFEEDKERLSRFVDKAIEKGKFRHPKNINDYAFLMLDWLYPVKRENVLEAHSKVWPTLMDRRDLYWDSIERILTQKKTDTLNDASYMFILGYSIKKYMEESNGNEFII